MNSITGQAVISTLGNDWRDFDFASKPVSVEFTDLRDIIFPNDVDFFQKLVDKSLRGCALPENDYSNFDFSGVSLECVEFTRTSILPSDPELFQKIADKSLRGCALPENDYSNFNFSGVALDTPAYVQEAMAGSFASPDNILMTGCVFTSNSKLPVDNDLFQKIAYKSLVGAVLPTGNYSTYDFRDVYIQGCSFTNNSKLPYDDNFFQNLGGQSICATVLPIQDFSSCDFEDIEIEFSNFPYVVAHNICKYKLDVFESIQFDCDCDYIAPQAALDIIKLKYRDLIAQNIIELSCLPSIAANGISAFETI